MSPHSLLPIVSDDAEEIQRRDELTVEIVRGMNVLLLKSESENLIAITHILTEARRKIAEWAVNDDHKELGEAKMPDDQPRDNDLYIALRFLASFTALKDPATRDELINRIVECETDEVFLA